MWQKIPLNICSDFKTKRDVTDPTKPIFWNKIFPISILVLMWRLFCGRMQWYSRTLLNKWNLLTNWGSFERQVLTYPSKRCSVSLVKLFRPGSQLWDHVLGSHLESLTKPEKYQLDSWQLEVIKDQHNHLPIPEVKMTLKHVAMDLENLTLLQENIVGKYISFPCLCPFDT